MKKRYSFIGAGNMAGAIISGITKKDGENRVDDADICIYDVNKAQYDKYNGRKFCFAESISEAVDFADYIVLAVKPQNYREVLGKIAEDKNGYENKTFISIAAGISTTLVCGILGEKTKVVRTMPNTPLLIGKGVTALCRNAFVADDDFDKIKAVFDSMGMTMILDEKDMNKIISVTSTSPAYVFLLIKAMCDGARAQGLDYDELVESVCKTVIGSATLLMNSDKTPEELVSMVASKGGTTEQALLQLEKYSFEEGIAEAMKKCTDRADVLGKNM